MPTIKYKWTVAECSSYEDMSRQAASYFIKQLRKKPDSVLGLATGNTPIGLYKELCQLTTEQKISFNKTTSFNLDEYYGLPREHPQSYASFMNAHLFPYVDMPEDQQHIPNGIACDAETEAKRYEQLITESGGIDLQILGLGSNGHIGFNEPGTSFHSTTHLVELDETTRSANARFFSTLEEVPTHAYTMGIATIMRAKKIILLISGSGKQAAFDRLLYGSVDESFPASILRLHRNVSIYYHR